MDHLLTCECGRKLSVNTKQSGQELTCECGKRLVVPTMRGLSQLPVDPASQASPSPRSSVEAARSAWSGWRGPMFALSVGRAADFWGLPRLLSCFNGPPLTPVTPSTPKSARATRFLTSTRQSN